MNDDDDDDDLFKDTTHFFNEESDGLETPTQDAKFIRKVEDVNKENNDI